MRFRRSTEDFLVLTDQFMCLSSTTSVATDMDIDKAPGDEEATLRVGKSDQPSLVELSRSSIGRVSDISLFL